MIAQNLFFPYFLPEIQLMKVEKHSGGMEMEQRWVKEYIKPWMERERGEKYSLFAAFRMCY